MAQPGSIFDPIMRRVEEFCHSFDGELEDLGEEEELQLLAEKCLEGIFINFLSSINNAIREMRWEF